VGVSGKRRYNNKTTRYFNNGAGGKDLLGVKVNCKVRRERLGRDAIGVSRARRVRVRRQPSVKRVSVTVNGLLEFSIVSGHLTDRFRDVRHRRRLFLSLSRFRAVNAFVRRVGFPVLKAPKIN